LNCGQKISLEIITSYFASSHAQQCFKTLGWTSPLSCEFSQRIFVQGSLLPVPDPFGNHNGPLERHAAVSGRRSEPQYLQQRSKAYLGANSGLIRKQFAVITWISDLGWESAATTVLGQSALNRVRESPYSWTAGPGAERFSPEMVSIKSTNFSPSSLSAALRKKTANSRVIHNYRD
jgi:hypothetical protein